MWEMLLRIETARLQRLPTQPGARDRRKESGPWYTNSARDMLFTGISAHQDLEMHTVSLFPIVEGFSVIEPKSMSIHGRPKSDPQCLLAQVPELPS